MKFINKYNSIGFSLIELMVVIAIIAILSAVAVPSYRSYVIRSKITEAFSLANAMKTKVELAYSENGSLPTGCPGAGGDIIVGSSSVDRVRWCASGGGRIEIWLNQAVNSSEFNVNPINNQVWLAPTVNNDIINWNCGTSANAAFEVDCKYLPSSCTVNCP